MNKKDKKNLRPFVIERYEPIQTCSHCLGKKIDANGDVCDLCDGAGVTKAQSRRCSECGKYRHHTEFSTLVSARSNVAKPVCDTCLGATKASYGVTNYDVGGDGAPLAPIKDCPSCAGTGWVGDKFSGYDPSKVCADCEGTGVDNEQPPGSMLNVVYADGATMTDEDGNSVKAAAMLIKAAKLFIEAHRMQAQARALREQAARTNGQLTKSQSQVQDMTARLDAVVKKVGSSTAGYPVIAKPLAPRTRY